MTTQFKLHKGRLAEPALHTHVTMTWKGRELLGEVISVDYCHGRGIIELTIRFMNGELWPLKPSLLSVRKLTL